MPSVSKLLSLSDIHLFSDSQDCLVATCKVLGEFIVIFLPLPTYNWLRKYDVIFLASSSSWAMLSAVGESTSFSFWSISFQCKLIGAFTFSILGAITVLICKNLLLCACMCVLVYMSVYCMLSQPSLASAFSVKLMGAFTFSILGSITLLICKMACSKWHYSCRCWVLGSCDNLFATQLVTHLPLCCPVQCHWAVCCG